MSELDGPMTRKEFLGAIAAAALAVVFVKPATGHARVMKHDPLKHPEPRPDITSANVLPDEKLGTRKSVRAAYADARAHPEIFDGIACACGCHDKHRSLLTCYETMQPTGCQGCIEEAQLVGKEAAAGHALVDVRAAVDKWIKDN
jgi:hypothetical protein